MKRKWHLKTRLLVTFAGLICALLIAVAVVFNFSIRRYINSRVNAQLESVSASISDERKGGGHGGKFEDKPDKVTGSKGNAFLLSAEGKIVSVFRGENETAELIAESFRNGEIESGGKYSTISSGEATYAVTITDDSVQKNAYLVSFLDITAVNELASRVNTILFVVIIAAILLCFILSRLFARSLAKPVQSLSEFAREIGGGNLEPREMSFREMELSGLADSMNIMAKELKESKSKQEVFFQNVSHELRTPLTSIRGKAEGIVCGVMEPKEAGNIIIRETDRLASMVEDILYISRMDKDLDLRTAEALDIRDTLSLCVSEQRSEAESKGVSFSFDFDEEPVLLRIRERDAEKIFGNIISNAIRYAKSDINISCHKTDASVTVKIGDNGPGIPEKDLPHIFERFYKGEGGRYGIGLAIVKEAVSVYQGSVIAANDSGAVLTVEFPENVS